MKQEKFNRFTNQLTKELKTVFEQFLNQTQLDFGQCAIEIFRKEQSLKPLLGTALAECCKGVVFGEMHGSGQHKNRRNIDYVCLLDKKVIAVELKYDWIHCGKKTARGTKVRRKLEDAAKQVRDFKSESGNWNIDHRVAIVIAVPFIKVNLSLGKQKDYFKECEQTLKNLKSDLPAGPSLVYKEQKLVPKNRKHPFFKAKYGDNVEEIYPRFILLAKSVE